METGLGPNLTAASLLSVSERSENSVDAESVPEPLLCLWPRFSWCMLETVAQALISFFELVSVSMGHLSLVYLSLRCLGCMEAGGLNCSENRYGCYSKIESIAACCGGDLISYDAVSATDAGMVQNPALYLGRQLMSVSLLLHTHFLCGFHGFDKLEDAFLLLELYRAC
ncbi:hypothetical protein Nepgr_005292 [Nepenthes gracilis]|uniref:Uncharacterized protein n=1 Tax=Nepenthes gracilis TaxID=150966 RepID=A0AAD3S2W5_NEPGR|nr:hypothetical protein Nepgr_005292 [Nepenthes gracilis]